ncbi:MAG: hypothetical protein HY243_18100 [Proteobacteria bacterium]|nr:hypothetical protein [Pseudomonadota bacterium]
MTARTGILILLAIVCLTTSWMLGYREGQQEGAFRLLREGAEYTIDTKEIKDVMDMDRDQVCNEIRDYKLSMARDLDENTQICGWPDMDGPKNSN